MKALLIGGTGAISFDVTKRCAEKGWDITLLNRGNRNNSLPADVSTIQANLENEREVGQFIKGATFDVVVNFIVYTPNQLERDIRLFTGKTGHYIFVSSASAYDAAGDPLVTESRRLYNPYWQYSMDKIACEEILLQEYRKNGFPATIVRPSHTYSDRSLPLILHGKKGQWQTLERMRQGKPIIMPGDGTSLWCVTHSRDFAVAFEGLMGRMVSLGEAYHITSDECLPWNRIYEEIGIALGVHPVLRHISTDMLVKRAPDLAPGLYGDKIHSVIFDNSKIKRLVPWYSAKIPFARGVRRTVQTFLSTPALQLSDPEFDLWSDEMVSRIDSF